MTQQQQQMPPPELDTPVKWLRAATARITAVFTQAPSVQDNKIIRPDGMDEAADPLFTWRLISQLELSEVTKVFNVICGLAMSEAERLEVVVSGGGKVEPGQYDDKGHDYTQIPQALSISLKEAGLPPLSEMQYMIVSGFLAGVQMNIEQSGLDETIKNLAQANAKSLQLHGQVGPVTGGGHSVN